MTETCVPARPARVMIYSLPFRVGHVVRFALLPWIREYYRAARGTVLVGTVSWLRRPIVGHRAQPTDKLCDIEDIAGVNR